MYWQGDGVYLCTDANVLDSMKCIKKLNYYIRLQTKNIFKDIVPKPDVIIVSDPLGRTLEPSCMRRKKSVKTSCGCNFEENL